MNVSFDQESFIDLANLQIKYNEIVRSLEDSQLHEKHLSEELNREKQKRKIAEKQLRESSLLSMSQVDLDNERLMYQAKYEALKTQLDDKEEELMTLRAETINKDPEVIRFVHFSGKCIGNLAEKGSTELISKLKNVRQNFQDFLSKSSSLVELFQILKTFLEIIVVCNIELTNKIEEDDQGEVIKKLKKKLLDTELELQTLRLEHSKTKEREEISTKNLNELRRQTDELMLVKNKLEESTRQEHNLLTNLASKLLKSLNNVHDPADYAIYTFDEQIDFIELSVDRLVAIKNENETIRKIIIDFASRTTGIDLTNSTSLASKTKLAIESTTKKLISLDSVIRGISNIISYTGPNNNELVSHLRSYIDNLTQNAQDHNREYVKMATINKDLTIQVGEMQKKFIDLESQSLKYQEEINDLKLNLQNVTDDKYLAEQELAKVSTELTSTAMSYQQQIKNFQSMIAEMRTSESRKIDEIDALNVQNQKLENQFMLVKQDLESITDQNKQLFSKNQDKQEEILRIQGSLRDANIQLKEKDDTIESLRNEIDNMRGSNISKLTDIERIHAQKINDMIKTHQQQLEEVEFKHKNQLDEIQELNSKRIEALQKSNEMEISETNRKGEEKIQVLERQNDAKSKEIESIRLRMKKLEYDNHKMAQRIEKLLRQNNEHAAEAIGSKNIISELNDLVTKLRQTNRDLESENNQLKQTVSDQIIEIKTQTDRYYNLREIEGKYNEALLETNSNKRTLQEANDRVRELEIRQTELTSELEASATKSNELEHQNLLMSTELSKNLIKLNELEVKIKMLEDDSKLHIEEARKRQMEIAENTAEIAKLLTENNQLKEKNLLIERTLQEKETKLRQLKDSKKQAHSMRNTLSDAASRLEEKENELAALKFEFNKLKNQLEDEKKMIEEENEKNLVQIDNLKRQLFEAREQAKQLSILNASNKSDYNDDIKRLKEDIKHLQQTIATMKETHINRDEVSKLDDTIVQYKSDIENYKMEISRYREIINKRDDDITMLSNEIAEKENMLLQYGQMKQLSNDASDKFNKMTQKMNQKEQVIRKIVESLHTISDALSGEANITAIINSLKPLYSTMNVGFPIIKRKRLFFHDSVIFSVFNHELIESFSRANQSQLRNICSKLSEFKLDKFTMKGFAGTLSEKLDRIHNFLSTVYDSYTELEAENKRLNSIVTSQHNAIMKMSQIQKSPSSSPHRPPPTSGNVHITK